MGPQVHHGSAASLGRVVKVRGKPSGGAAVVGVPDPGVGDFPQLAAFHQGLGGFQGGPGLVGVGDGELHAALLHGGGNGLGVLVGKGQDLLGEDVLPGLGGGNEYLGVLAGGGGNLHALNGGVSPDGGKVRLEGDAQLLGGFLAPDGIVVPQAAELGAGVLLNGGGVLHGVDMPRADRSYFHGGHSFLQREIYRTAPVYTT